MAKWKPSSYKKKSTGKYVTFDSDHSTPFSVRGAAKKLKDRGKTLDERIKAAGG